METLAIALRDTYSYGKLHVMIGMLANKNHRDTLRHILPLVDTLIITEPDFRKKLAADELRAMAAEAENGPADITVESDWRKALELLQRRTEPGDLAVVTGTLYLIADVRSRLLYNTDSEKGW